MAEALVPIQSVGVIVPLLMGASFALPVFSLFIKRRSFYYTYACVFSGIALIATAVNTYLVIKLGKPIVYLFSGWPPPIGIVYEVDLLSATLGLLTAFIMFLITLYSVHYIKDPGYVWYYTLLLGLEAGLLGCIYTGDVFNLFVMIEVLSISAYALVSYYRSRPQAVEAAMKYAIFGAVATTIYFLAVIFIYASYGTLAMADLAIKSRTLGPTNVFSGGLFGNVVVATAIAIALSLWAFTYKAALFPNHFWLPDAHPEAPTPVSAALSGLVVNVGAYAVVRLLYTIFGRGSVVTGFRDVVLDALLILGILSGFVGALLMVVQNDVKRLLAYSTVSHMGLIFMGISLGLSNLPTSVVSAGLTAALYHIINHSVGKALLFMGVGIFIVLAGGTRDLNKLNGYGRLNKLAMIAVLIGFLQLMGVPPLGGFFSKLLLYLAFVKAGMLVPAVMVVLISAISVMGYIKVIHVLWFKPLEGEVKGRVGPQMTAVVFTLAIACIALGILNPFMTKWLTNVINSSLVAQGISNYINSFNQVVLNVLRLVG